MRLGVVFLCLAVSPGLTMAEEGHGNREESGKKAVEVESAELIFSKSGSLAFNMAGGKASISGLYYGSEHFRVGAVGIAPVFKAGHWLIISPGLNAAIIKNEQEELHGESHEPEASYRSLDPAASLRWKMHAGGDFLGIVSEGALLQALLPTGGVRNFYTDGAHLSVQLGRLEVGGTPAIINHGSERERKGGVRLALADLYKGLGVAGFVLWPGKPEYRFGLVYNNHH